jgi:hypothetical protein
MHIGPDAILAVLRVRLHRDLGGGELIDIATALREDVCARFPDVVQVCLDLASLDDGALTRAQGSP